MFDKEKAEAKLRELFQLMLDTPPEKKKEVSWELLNEWRLQALKARRDDSAVKRILLNHMMKESKDLNPFLPQEIIDFIKPTLIL